MTQDYPYYVSRAQAVTTTAVSTDAIDLRAATDLGEGQQIMATFLPKTSPTAAGAATVTFEVIMASDAALTTSIVVLASSPAVAIADLAVPSGVGRPLTPAIVLPLRPVMGSTGRRYLGARYTIATGPLTGGTFTCFFGPGHIGEASKRYPTGTS